MFQTIFGVSIHPILGMKAEKKKRFIVSKSCLKDSVHVGGDLSENNQDTFSKTDAWDAKDYYL